MSKYQRNDNSYESRNQKATNKDQREQSREEENNAMQEREQMNTGNEENERNQQGRMGDDERMERLGNISTEKSDDQHLNNPASRSEIQAKTKHAGKVEPIKLSKEELEKRKETGYKTDEEASRTPDERKKNI